MQLRRKVVFSKSQFAYIYVFFIDPELWLNMCRRCFDVAAVLPLIVILSMMMSHRWIRSLTCPFVFTYLLPPPPLSYVWCGGHFLKPAISSIFSLFLYTLLCSKHWTHYKDQFDQKKTTTIDTLHVHSSAQSFYVAWKSNLHDLFFFSPPCLLSPALVQPLFIFEKKIDFTKLILALINWYQLIGLKHRLDFFPAADHPKRLLIVIT